MYRQSPFKSESVRLGIQGIGLNTLKGLHNRPLNFIGNSPPQRNFKIKRYKEGFPDLKLI